MYYEEQWIEGALCWRTSPYGAWTRYTANELAHRYESAEKRASDAQATVEALQAQVRELEQPVYVCQGCGRLGRDGWLPTSFTSDELRGSVQCPDCGCIDREKNTARELAAICTKALSELTQCTAELEALQRERDKLREATKVICGHCCEPMAIPSRAILQSQLSALQALMRALPKCEGWVSVIQAATDEWHIYDGIFTTEESAHAYAALLTYRATLGENS